MSAPAVSRPVGRVRTRRGRVIRSLLLTVGVGCIVAGVALVVLPLYQLWQRGRADDQALTQWQQGGSAAFSGPLRAGEPSSAAAPTCGSGAPGDYALVTFPSLQQYGYAGVAGDGTWDDLHSRSMVHYRGTAAPGEKGNSIIAFHREPHYEHIDMLKVGSTIAVQDRSCHTYSYRVDKELTLTPEQVTQQRILVSTSGHDLTLITCTPWFVDSQRLVWQAHLVA